MSGVIATVGPSAYWYLARGTGVVALLFLTASVVLGILGSVRFAVPPRWPRFTVDSLHRDVSLLVIVLLVVHIITSVLDSFAPIKLLDAVIPFASQYRPLWLGFGALSFDILMALVVTSLVRRRLGYGAWRAIHWLAYASWPVAVLHGLGTGSDTKAGWALALTAACAGAVVLAVLARIIRSDWRRETLRAPTMALTFAVPVGIAVFTYLGPLQHGWARRAGTPASLLRPTFTASAATGRTAAATVGQGRAASSQAAAANRGPVLKAPFSARLSGNVTQTQEPGGAVIDLRLRLLGGARGLLRVRLAGAPLGGGGLSLTGSQVDLAAVGLPSVLEGRIVSLAGDQFIARVAGASGTVLDLRASLQIDDQTNTVSGTLSATQAGVGGG